MPGITVCSGPPRTVSRFSEGPDQISGQLLRFLVVGSGNTLVGLLVIYAAKGIGGWGDLAANLAGYGVGLVSSVLLNRSWTFGHADPLPPALARLLLVFLCAYALNLATVLLLIEQARLDDYLAQALGIAPYTLSFFWLMRLIVFRRT